MDDGDEQRPDRALPMHERIRRRRQDLGLAAYEVARRAGITPSYMSLIESGKKVPSITVAVKIAQVLGDDPELYSAWSEAGYGDDLDERISRLERLRDSQSPVADELTQGKGVGSSVEAAAERSMSGGGLRRLLGSLRSKRSRPGRLPPDAAVHDLLPGDEGDSPPYPGPATIPVLQAGADPGTDPASSDRIEDWLVVDPRMLPEDAEAVYAYRPGRRMLRHVRDVVQPGDVVVLTARRGKLGGNRIHALRFRDEIVLSRVLFKGNALLLLPPEGSDDFELLELDESTTVDDLVVGTVVLTMKSWGAGGKGLDSVASYSSVEELASPLPDSLATKSGGRQRQRRGRRIKDNLVVRDCHWADKYGWRPIQRPEDMDYLDEHPDTKMRFRLIRDDVVRFHLDMTADQWREALGDYGEGSTWRTNGYIVAITKRREGRYTEEFQERWAGYVTAVDA